MGRTDASARDQHVLVSNRGGATRTQRARLLFSARNVLCTRSACRRPNKNNEIRRRHPLPLFLHQRAGEITCSRGVARLAVVRPGPAGDITWDGGVAGLLPIMPGCMGSMGCMVPGRMGWRVPPSGSAPCICAMAIKGRSDDVATTTVAVNLRIRLFM